jgi:hypothetical protein
MFQTSREESGCIIIPDSTIPKKRNMLNKTTFVVDTLIFCPRRPQRAYISMGNKSCGRLKGLAAFIAQSFYTSRGLTRMGSSKKAEAIGGRR